MLQDMLHCGFVLFKCMHLFQMTNVIGLIVLHGIFVKQIQMVSGLGRVKQIRILTKKTSKTSKSHPTQQGAQEQHMPNKIERAHHITQHSDIDMTTKFELKSRSRPIFPLQISTTFDSQSMSTVGLSLDINRHDNDQQSADKPLHLQSVSTKIDDHLSVESVNQGQQTDQYEQGQEQKQEQARQLQSLNPAPQHEHQHQHQYQPQPQPKQEQEQEQEQKQKQMGLGLGQGHGETEPTELENPSSVSPNTTNTNNTIGINTPTKAVVLPLSPTSIVQLSTSIDNENPSPKSKSQSLTPASGLNRFGTSAQRTRSLSPATKSSVVTVRTIGTSNALRSLYGKYPTTNEKIIHAVHFANDHIR